MSKFSITVLVCVLMLSSKKPFSQSPETALTKALNKEKVEESIVFIAGFDEGENTYYTNAKRYFENRGMPIVDSLYALDEIINYLNTMRENQVSFKEIHVVSHSNAWLGMSLKITNKGERITTKTLQNAIRSNSFKPAERSIAKDSKIIFHACGLGENKELLQELKNTFGAKQVYASTYFNVFGGKFADHYLAKPYYGYYPTAESKGPAHLAEEFKQKYPDVAIDWFTALQTRQESSFGEAFSFKFNIPVDWEFTFDNTIDMPKLENKEAIMDWISESPEMAEVLLKLNIPIEKFRWISAIQGNTLLIKGKTTVLCVLAPILQSNDGNEYQKVTVNNPSLYQIL